MAKPEMQESSVGDFRKPIYDKSKKQSPFANNTVKWLDINFQMWNSVVPFK